MNSEPIVLYGPDGKALQAQRPRTRYPRGASRHYEGAEASNLYADWLVTSLSADQAILPHLQRLRNRCRSLEKDNAYVRRFMTLLKVYVFGSTGIGLECKTRHRRRTDLVNKRLSESIEEQWEEFSELGDYDVTGKFSLRSGDILALRRCVIDGEIFIRLVRGFDNEWGFAVQFIEADWIDHEFHMHLDNGNWIRGGVEFNEWERPVAYWVTHDPVGSVDPMVVEHGPRIRIPAEEMIHVGVFERLNQSRCVPWIVAAIRNLKMFGEYESAEVIAARATASKMGFIEREMDSVPYTNAEEDPATGRLVSEMAAGVIELLDPGQKFTPFDPGQPKSTFPEFRKAFLRGISCAFDVGYNALAGDLEGVNYSSLRHGQKDDVEVYRDLQAWWLSLVRWPIFEAWLEMALLKRAIDGGSFEDLERIENSVQWNPRGFQYVDPAKDAQADLLQIANKMETRTAVLNKRGRDFEEVIETLAEEEDLADEFGIDLTPIGIGGGGAPKSGGGAGSSTGGGTGEPPAQPRNIAIALNGQKNENGHRSRGEARLEALREVMTEIAPELEEQYFSNGSATSATSRKTPAAISTRSNQTRGDRRKEPHGRVFFRKHYPG